MVSPILRKQRAPWRRRAIGLVGLAAVIVASSLSTAVPADAANTLVVAASSSAWAKVGASRLTSIAEVAVKIPAPASELGLQFRAKTTGSGYRATIKIASNGTVTGAFNRLAPGKESKIGGARSLGFIARPGDIVHLQATVVAKKKVRLYLRAWTDGSARPAAWQMMAKDSSIRRIARAGSTYVWARPIGANVRFPYTVVSVAPFSAIKAAAIGVESTPPPRRATTFSIAVIGDTQNETNSDIDPRFSERTSWLAANKDALNLRYVLHTGDVVNWGWLAPRQYANARNAMARLTAAKIPWLVAVGNHDTRAVGWDNIAGSTGYGGSAYMYNPECPRRLGDSACDTKLLVRKTDEFNRNFPVGNVMNVGGTFEAGKIDNTWATFTAHSTKWLVLNLEFAPRRSAVEWARRVVAAHPHHNVIIDTHFYLSRKGGISTSNAGYGETSGRYIYNQIVSKYPNVKIVVSGHTGSFARRTDTNKGNRTVSYLGNELGGSENPVRVLTIDTRSGKVTNTIYSKVKPGSAKPYRTDSNTISVIH